MKISNESLQAMVKFRPGAKVKISGEHLAAMAAEILKARGYKPEKRVLADNHSTMLPESIVSFYRILHRWI